MSIKGLKIDSDIHNESPDTLGGGFTLNTNLYPMKVDLAFTTESSKGATGVVVHFKPVDGGNSVLRETFWVTSGKAKGQKNFYMDGQGRKRLLPGMMMANQIALITTGKELAEQDTEEKVVKLYDFDAGKEMPKKVDALTAMIGQQILVGVHKRRENRRTQNADGEWVNTPQERTFNETHRVFHPDGFTVTEKAAEAEEAVFVKKWADRYDESYVNDQYEPVAGAESGDSSAAPAADGGTEKLFG